MKLLRVILRVRDDIKANISSNLFVELFKMTVVQPEGPFVAKCLSEKSRRAAFGLMKELSSNPETYKSALELVLPLFKNQREAMFRVPPGVPTLPKVRQDSHC